MIDIHVHIHCPDLVSAAGTLAAALDSRKAQERPQSAPETPQAPAAPQPEPVPQPQGFSVPMATPPQPATVAPVATPAYTIRDIAMAGAALIRDNAAIQPQLNSLLGQFGCKQVTDLKPDQLPVFAAALRQLGAKL